MLQNSSNAIFTSVCVSTLFQLIQFNASRNLVLFTRLKIRSCLTLILQTTENPTLLKCKISLSPNGFGLLKNPVFYPPLFKIMGL